MNFYISGNMGTIKKYSDEHIINSGENRTHIALSADYCLVEQPYKVDNNDIARLSRGAFVAEISFLTGEPASADVVTKNEVIGILWRKMNG